MFLKNRNIILKIKRSNVTDYAALINSVSDIRQPNINVLLSGDISLTFDQNKQIFKAVQEFIINSKRFEYTY